MIDDEIKTQIADDVDKIVRRASVFTEGIGSPFWKELDEMMAELEGNAFKRWTDASAADTAVIIELQTIGKLRRVLTAKIHAAIQDAEALVQ